MKIRSGFVSNSSSSSFICDVCGEATSGWDMSLQEAEMYECENGHVICEHHISDITWEQKKEFVVEKIQSNIEYYSNMFTDPDRGDYYTDEKLNNRIDGYKEQLEEILAIKTEEDDEDCAISELMDDYEIRSELPEKFCPLCSFEEIANEDLVSYLVKTTGVTREEVFAEVKQANKRRKKLRSEEYIMHVCIKLGVTVDSLISEAKDKFVSYKEFKKFLKD